MQKITLLSILIMFYCLFANKTNAQDIIPKPESIILKEGVFEFDKNISIAFDKKNQDLKALAFYFQNQFEKLSGYRLLENKNKAKKIQISLFPDDNNGKEAYSIDIQKDLIDIKATTKSGVFDAFQTIFQLFPSCIRTNSILSIPCCAIKDAPRFAWRGMHLDVSRHFFSVDFVKEYLDLMAKYKLNVFHWHLTDDTGWRIEIKKYPKLTNIGAWRADRRGKLWHEKEPYILGEPTTYGGFYTQAQIKEIIAYAAERNIQVVPEIEMPAHCMAAIAAYPEFSCKAIPIGVQTGGQYHYAPSFCAGKDSVFTFLQDILTEVIALFPSEYIHVGGDELDKIHWKECPKCQQRIKAEHLKNEEELQSYFMHRIATYLQQNGRKMIGWDEILEGGLTPNATVMSWRGESGGIAAAKMGHEVIMTPTSHCYFDYYQADPATEPPAFGGFISLKKVYQYEPIPNALNSDEAKWIKGAEATLWTESIPSVNQAEYMLLPRMLALSEVLWTNKEQKDWTNFRNRLEKHFYDFEQLGINYCKGNYKTDIIPQINNGKISATLYSEDENTNLLYTIDGSEPSPLSEKYKGIPINIDKTLTLKAIAYKNGKAMSLKATEQAFDIQIATAKKVSYLIPFSKYYPANNEITLTDGIRGNKNHGSNWHGFAGNNLEILIDLEQVSTFQTLSLGALQNYKSWIFFPEKVRFEISNDGQQFTLANEVQNTVSMQEKSVLIKDFSFQSPTPVRARFIKIIAYNPKFCPKGHPGEGKESWIFFDEVMVR